MKKRVLSSTLSCLLAVCLILGLCVPAQALGSLSNFNRTRTYEAGQFADVDDGAWYSSYVARAYEYALIDGDGTGRYNPAGKVTLAETVKLAVCLHRDYYSVKTELPSGGAWYEPYVTYAKQNGIIKEDYSNYDAAATRADFAAIIGAALPDEAVTAINRVDDNALPDVLMSYSYGSAVYKLYRAGVLTGSDRRGTFYPGRSIQRAEAAAICVRMLDAEAREQQTLTGEMKAEELYIKYSSAVFYIEIFDKDEQLVKTGSGFFINESGDAVTNFHVIAGGYSAKVTTADGEIYDVLGVYDYDWKKDIALISVGGSSFDYLQLGNSDKAMTGETVYAIGSPLGLQNTMSRGIISSAQRVLNGVRYIQTDAPLSHGSSGGPLLSAGGLVVGIVSAGADGGQNLNLAVPINLVSELDSSELSTLESHIGDIVNYKKHPGVPDLGAFEGVEPFRSESTGDSGEYSYKTADFGKPVDEVLDDYRLLLEKSLYSLFGYYEDGDNVFEAYLNSITGVLVMFGIEKIAGFECITVMIRPML